MSGDFKYFSENVKNSLVGNEERENSLNLEFKGWENNKIAKSSVGRKKNLDLTSTKLEAVIYRALSGPALLDFLGHPGCSTFSVHHPTWPLFWGGTLDPSLQPGGGVWRCLGSKLWWGNTGI